MFDLIENIRNWNNYKDKLVLGKYLIQTSNKKELVTPKIKIKNYIMTKKIDNKFLDFRQSYFNRFRATNNILVENLNQLFSDYLIENDYYSIKNNYDIIINDYSMDILIKEIIRDLIILEYDNKQVLIYLGNRENIIMDEIGDYIIYEHPRFTIFNIRILRVFPLEQLQAYFGLQFRQTNSLRILDRIIRLFNKQQEINDIVNQDDKITALFTKNNVDLLQQYDFKKYLYFNKNYKLEWDKLLNIASVGTVGCLTGDTLIEIPRNLVDNPNGVTIKEMYLNKEKYKYIYSYNIEKQQIELDEIVDIWESGIKQIYQITLENGYTIKASEEHPFLVVSNFKNNIPTKFEFKKLKELTTNDKLLIFNRSKFKLEKDGEYIKINYFNGKKRVLEHRFIMEQLNKFSNNKNKEIVHHKDENKYNNSVENLEVMSIYEHSSYHTKKRGLYGKNIWKNGEHPKGFKGKSHKTKKVKYFENLGFDYYKIINKINQTNNKVNYHIPKNELSAIRKKSRVNYYSKIKSITKLDKVMTYDLEVKKNHNYIANKFIVHNSGKTFTLNLILLQLLLSGNFKRIIYFDTQNSFNDTIMYNVNPIYLSKAKSLQDIYFKIDESNFYLSELDFINAVNFLLETRGYGEENQKAQVLKTDYEDYQDFIRDVNELLEYEKKRLGFKNLSKIDDIEAVNKFIKKIKVKENSIFDDLESNKKFFVIFNFQDSLFYSVSTFLYLQKLKDLLYSRDEKRTYLITDETQKYLSSTFLKNVLLDLVKEKRQFGFRFYFTGLSYQDISEFIKFAHHIIFNSFNDVYMLNTLKSMINSPIDNLKTPKDKLINDTVNNKAEKTELELNLLQKSKSIKAFINKHSNELTDDEKKKLEEKSNQE